MATASFRTASMQLTEAEMIDHLCRLSLNPENAQESVDAISALSPADRAPLVKLADAHHVIIRAFEPVLKSAAQKCDAELIAWTTEVLQKERARIDNALLYLHAICAELEAAGCPTTVMKSLDHLPDLGNDLDLYTTADEEQFCAVMTRKFNAKIGARSWGDRIAQKWNFEVPGLPESVEIHAQRLGQMGEHRSLAQRFVSRRVQKMVNGRAYFVPAPEERIVVATLQRMYRHFYFRVCDLVNSSKIVDSGELDFTELKRATEAAGIWPGVATYLNIVSGFANKYRGHGLDLPASVTSAALCGAEKIHPRSRFLRVPIRKEGLTLFTTQMTKAAFNGDVEATFRLGMLPYLATAAAVAYKITGSDKGVW